MIEETKSLVNPLVSICIPTFNGQKYVEESLVSALNQTYTNIEIVISDDYSSDGTLEIVNSIRNNSNVPFFIHHHAPNGIGANWNNCVIHAKGNYIKFLFQDDILDPFCIEKMMQVALKDKRIGLVFSRRNFLYPERNNFVDEMLTNYKELHVHWTNLRSINSGPKLLKECYCLLDTPVNKVGEPTAVLLKKDVFRKVGFFNERLVQVLDYEYWYRVFKYYKIGFIDEELATFRLHDMQASQRNVYNNGHDNMLFDKMLYDKLFFQLPFNIQKILFKKYNKFYKLFKQMKNKLNINTGSGTIGIII